MTKSLRLLLRSVLGLALLRCACAGLAAQPAGSGQLQGTVTDSASHALLVGALVRIEGANLETSTDHTGAYHFTSVPAGTQTLTVSYLGLDPSTAAVTVTGGSTTTHDVALAGGTVIMEAYKVESIREGQARAINEQRASNTITNVEASDAIGNLPDNTVADALSRLPGINVEQDDGQSSYVTIRGLAPQLNAIHLDGQPMPSVTDSLDQSAGADTRSVNLSLIPSEIVSSVEVVKALTPDLDADSIGGQVNIKTKSGFEVAEPVVSGSVDQYFNEFKGHSGYGASVSYVGPLNQARTLGLGLDFNYRNVSDVEEDSETVWYPKTDPTVSAIPGITGNDAISEYDTRATQERDITFGGAINLDWKLGDTTVLKFRSFFNSSEGYLNKWRVRNAGLAAYSTTSTDTIASGTNARLRRIYYNQERSPQIFQESVTGETNLPIGKFNYLGSFNYTPQHSWLNRYDTDTASATRKLYSFTVNRTNPDFPTVRIFNTATGSSAYTDNTDSLLQVERQTASDAERNYVAGIDYTLPQTIGGIPVTFKVGAKYEGKDRKQRPVLGVWGPAANTVMSTFPTGNMQAPTNLFMGTIPSMGTFPSLPAVLNAVTANPAAYPFLATNTALNTILARTYNVDQSVDSAYGMATAEFGKLETIAGLRYEGTSTSYNWIGMNPHQEGSHSYGNALADLLANYRFNKDMVLRGSWTHTIARPDYNQLVPYTLTQDPAPSIDDSPVGLVQIYQGNPNLHAATASNEDVDFEWYLPPAGVASVGLFHKDISNFIFRNTKLATVNGQLTAYQQFQNGGKESENGMELSYSQALTMLPGPLSGLGFVANTSVVVGKSYFYELNPDNVTYSRVDQKFIPYQPKTTRNIQVYWEHNGFTARIAWNYVSAYVNPDDGHLPNVTVATARRVDATLQYQLTKHLILYVQGKNLRRQYENWYDYGNPADSEEVDYLGRSYVGGVKYHF